MRRAASPTSRSARILFQADASVRRHVGMGMRSVPARMSAERSRNDRRTNRIFAGVFPDRNALTHRSAATTERRVPARIPSYRMGWRGAAVLRRNAAVALGNALDRSAVPALIEALTPIPMRWFAATRHGLWDASAPRPASGHCANGWLASRTRAPAARSARPWNPSVRPPVRNVMRSAPCLAAALAAISFTLGAFQSAGAQCSRHPPRSSLV